MSKLADVNKQLKKIKKAREAEERLIRKWQAICPHRSKKGKTWLERFSDNGIDKARCRKCGEVVVIDASYTQPDMIGMSVEVIKTALAEIRAGVHVGKIELDQDTLDLMTKFDHEVLRELPETIGNMSHVMKKKKKKDKDRKKDKKRKHRLRL